MPLNDFLLSSEFKKYLSSPNYSTIVKYVIYYYLLFKEDSKKLEDLLNKIYDENMESNFISIVSAKLMTKNENKRKIYSNVLDRIGNLKYEIISQNESSSFEKIETILSKYNIKIIPRNKRVISNNIDKIVSIYPLLDKNLSSIAELVLGTNKVLYSSKDYYEIRKGVLEYLKDKSVSLLDTTMISYYLDRYYSQNKSEIIITNNIEINKELLDDTYMKYKNDLDLFLSDLLNDKKEKKATNTIELERIILPYEENPKVLESYFTVQEKIKMMQEEEIKSLLEKKVMLETNLENRA